MSKVVQLGDVADIITGPFGSQLHESDYKMEGIPVIMPQDIKDGKLNFEDVARISENDFQRLIRYSVQNGDIIFPRRGDIEKHAYIDSDEDFLCGTGCFRVRVKTTEINFKYLSYYLDNVHVRKWITNHAVGSNMPNLNTGILSEIPVMIPTYSVQIKIARLLSVIEAKIQNNVKINDNLEALAKLIYMNFFFNRTPNGLLSDIIHEYPKSQVQVNEAKCSNGRFPFFTSGNGILAWDSFFVDDRNCYINTGGNVGIRFYVGKAEYSTDTWCITAKYNLADYLYLLLKAIQHEIDIKYFTGTGLKHLQKPILKERPIYVPVEDEIILFNKLIQPYFDMISRNTCESQRLQDVRNSLLPLLINGQAVIGD